MILTPTQKLGAQGLDEDAMPMISHLSTKIRFLLSNPNNLHKSATAFGVTVLLASALVTGAAIILQQLGALEGLELAAYDQLVRSRPDEGSDERLLIVAINDDDIRQQNQFPIHDATLVKVLEKLEEYQPRAIGIDILRDVPMGEGRATLTNLLKQGDNIIAVCKLSSEDEPGNPAAPGVPKERIGFADLPLDPDTSIRRSILVSTPTPPKTPIEKPHLCNYDDPENPIYSLAFQLALLYLAQEGIGPETTEYGELKLGSTVFRRLEDHGGGYYSAGATDYQLMLNYRSAENAAEQVSITEVLSGKVEPTLVKDRVVLIGYTTTTANEDFTTPYSAGEQDRVEMPGVVIHAQSVSQILSAVLDNRPLIWYWSEWLEIFWIAGWSLLGGVLVAQTRNHPWLLVLSGIVGVGFLWSCAIALFLKGGWIPVVAPGLTFLLSSITVGVYQLQQSKQQEQMVMRLLGQQTSPKIAQALWKERDSLLESGLLPGQTLTATILLTDIKGFSSISERISPAVLMSWLNEYLAAMTQEVQKHQGIINKFTGDGILAVFGVPIPRTTSAEIAEDAQQAVACALAISDLLESLNRSWETRGLPIVQMRVGIFTGPVVVGSLGDKDRLEYGVIGDSVNIASRLESCEKDRQLSDCRILIAKETLAHLQGKFQVESWGFLALKGKQQKIEVYRILGSLLETDEGTMNN